MITPSFIGATVPRFIGKEFKTCLGIFLPRYVLINPYDPYLDNWVVVRISMSVH